MIRSGGGSARVSSAALDVALADRLRRAGGPRRRRAPGAGRPGRSTRARRTRAPGRASCPRFARVASVSAASGAAHERRQARSRRRSSSGGCRAPSARRAPRARTGAGAASDPPTSAAGRCQFCAENAYSVRPRMPISRAARTTRRTASAPWRCPSAREPPRAAAQRPLPSMMIATCRGSVSNGASSPQQNTRARPPPGRDLRERSRGGARTVAPPA